MISKQQKEKESKMVDEYLEIEDSIFRQLIKLTLNSQQPSTVLLKKNSHSDT